MEAACPSLYCEAITRRSVLQASLRAFPSVQQGPSSVARTRLLYSRRPLFFRKSRLSCAAGHSEGIIRKRLAVFVSGGGSNFRSIHQAILNGIVHGDVVIVVSDKPECKGCEYAREQGIPVSTFPKWKLSPDGLSPAELVGILRKMQVDYILLAGYLKLIPKQLVEAFPQAILNIHPALLPAFGGKGYYGIKIHEAVIASGARYSGPTIHFVDEKYDHGRILAQRIVPVLPNYSPKHLAAKVLEKEHTLYVEAVAALCENRIIWRYDGVPMIRRKQATAAPAAVAVAAADDDVAAAAAAAADVNDDGGDDGDDDDDDDDGGDDGGDYY